MSRNVQITNTNGGMIEKIVRELGLIAHPEGGWYKEVYRSDKTYPGNAENFPAGRSYATSIYFLITEGNFSAFHRIQSDETWHFYSGDPLEVIQITTEGKVINTILGNRFEDGQVFQYTVKAGNWFASRVHENGSWSLAGCTVAPGFDFRDFELASRDTLITEFPSLKNLVTELTRI